MRSIIIILFIQFISFGIAQAGIQEQPVNTKASYHSIHHEAGICLDVLFTEDSEEIEESNHRTFLAVELIDFSFLTSILTQQFSGCYHNNGNTRPLHEPLFKLNCTYLI